MPGAMAAPVSRRDPSAALDAALHHCRKAQVSIEEEAVFEAAGARYGVLLEIAGAFMVLRGRLERLRAA